MDLEYDGFEDGDASEWSGDTNIFAADNSTAGEGSYAGKLSKPNSTDNKLVYRSTKSGTTSPPSIDFYIRGSDHNTGSYDNGHVRFKNGSISGTQFIDVEMKMPNQGSNITINGTSVAGFSNDTWYYIELNNIDWSSDTIGSVSIDGTQVATNIGFQNSVSGFDTILISHDSNSDAETWADELPIGKTPAASTDSASNVSGTSATLNGALNSLEGNSSMDVYFEYRETGASTWNQTSIQTLSSTGSFSENVSGLSLSTEYEYRAVADDGSTTYTGSNVTFSTNRGAESFETFEDGDVAEWTVYNLSAVTDRAYNSTHSGFCSVAQSSNAQATRVLSSGGEQIKDFEFHYHETSSGNHGGGLRLQDSNGNFVIGAATDNPQQYIDDANGLRQVDSGSYQVWYRVRFVFDWENGTADVEWENTETNTTAVHSNRPLKQNTDIETVLIEHQNLETWRYGSNMNMWFDEMSYVLDDVAGSVFESTSAGVRRFLPLNSGYSMYFINKDSQSTEVEKSLGSSSTPSSFEFWFKKSSKNDNNAEFRLLDDTGTRLIKLRTFREFLRNETSDTDFVSSLENGQWYRVSLTNIDYTNEVFDATCYDINGNSIGSATSLEFLNSGSNILTFNINNTLGSNNGDADPLWIDDISYGGTTLDDFEDQDLSDWTIVVGSAEDIEIRYGYNVSGAVFKTNP